MLLLYSPQCLEGGFSEVRRHGVLRSSHSPGPTSGASLAIGTGAGLMSTTNCQERDRVWLFGGMDTSLSASSGVSTGSWRIFSRVRPKWVSTGEPLLRVKPKDLAAAGVERVRRVTGVQHGQPQLEDGRRIDVANVVWC